MKRNTFGALLVAAIFSLGGAADAGKGKEGSHTTEKKTQTETTTETTTDASTDMAAAKHTKHLGMIDLYLSTAINDLKLMSALADLPASELDKQTVAEVRKNLDMALMNAEKHVKSAMKTMKADAEMTSSLDELKMQLGEARAASKKLAKAKAADLSTHIDTIASHVMSADESFRKMSETAGFARLETMRLGAMPVRGEDSTEDPSMDPSLNEPKMQPSPPSKPQQPKDPGSVPDTGKNY